MKTTPSKSNKILVIEEYTVETLKAFNRSYDTEHGVTESDVIKANKIIADLHDQLETTTPHAGDIVICEGFNTYNEKEVTYKGHLEAVGKPEWGIKGLYVCTSPSGSHITVDLTFSTSGGYWVEVEPSKVSFVGYEMKSFWTWGHNGACGNGGFYFKAPVKVWKFKDNNLIY